MFRITINEPKGEATRRLIIEGCIAGPQAEELERAWEEASPDLDLQHLMIDVRNVTGVDAVGKSVLGKILSHAYTKFVARPLQTSLLALEPIGMSNRVRY